jgi:protein-S-isoprenylcysteine O-methyltransferase Ste14
MDAIENADLIDLTLRTIGLVLVTGLLLYWYFTEKHADRAKPKNRDAKSLKRLFSDVGWFLILVQLMGIAILPFPQNSFLQIIGGVFMLAGIVVCVVARRAIGTNWAHGVEFQIKKNQQLVTHSIYKHVRHPIYTGLLLVGFGAELIANSWLAVLGLIILIPVMFYQTEREEKLLVRHFGEAYKKYMKRSYKFIPNVI